MLVIDFWRFEKMVGHNENKPRWVEHRVQCHLAFLCCDLLPSSRPALLEASSLYGLEKNSCFYNQHSLPQVRGLSPKPTKRCWEEGHRSHFPPYVASQQIFNVSHGNQERVFCIYSLWLNQSKVFFYKPWKITNHVQWTNFDVWTRK